LLVFSASLLVLFARTCLAAEETDERNPPPSPSELAKAQKLVQELLGDEIAKTKPAGRAALAAKLLKQADESKDDMAGRYVLLRAARDMAAKAGDPILAAKAADDLAIEYRLSAGAAREPLAALATASMSIETAHLAADVLMAAADTAAGSDDYDPALSLLKAADTVARKSRYCRASNQVKTRLGQVEKLKTDAVAVQASVAKLKENADDPAANLAVGRFLCMAKRDWEAGGIQTVEVSQQATLRTKGLDLPLSNHHPKPARSVIGNHGQNDWIALLDRKSRRSLMARIQPADCRVVRPSGLVRSRCHSPRWPETSPLHTTVAGYCGSASQRLPMSIKLQPYLFAPDAPLRSRRRKAQE
jgi:hypothetical protein